MNYSAINAKLRAMSARPTKNYEAISQAVTSICLYIPSKNLRDYVIATALTVTQGGSIHFYMTQWKRLNRLDKPNRTVLRGILGAEIDLINILWMYRLKRYHRITGDATFGYLVPIRYKLSREITRRMAESATAKALLDEVADSPYAKDFGRLKTGEYTSEAWENGRSTPEQMLAEIIGRRYQVAARRYPNSLAPVLAYLYKLRMTLQSMAGR